MVKLFFHQNPWQMMTFLNPLDALIPEIPFSFFADFWVWVTSEARGSVSVGFWGSRQLSPVLGEGSRQGAVSTPPPPSPQLRARPPFRVQQHSPEWVHAWRDAASD